MPYNRADALVSTEWLADHLSAPDVRVVDASFSLDPSRNPRAEYDDCHIPGAVFFDIDDIADTTSPYKHTLPAPEVFSSKVRRLGLGDGNHIVVYDSNGGVMAACRVWWMFRLFGAENVSVLDGGLPKWQAEGRPVEDLPPMTRNRHFTARVNSPLARSADEINTGLSKGIEQVIDARSAERYRGEAAEPRPTIRQGHIPGSLNLPFPQMIDPESKTFKSAKDLQAAFDAAGIDLSKPTVASCGSGVTACVIAMGAYLLGKTDVAVFDGSWAEWGMREDLPFEQG
jgi:thiosulfate/3-mercaptopyruvate sulfurtransferase